MYQLTLLMQEEKKAKDNKVAIMAELENMEESNDYFSKNNKERLTIQLYDVSKEIARLKKNIETCMQNISEVDEELKKFSKMSANRVADKGLFKRNIQIKMIM